MGRLIIMLVILAVIFFAGYMLGKIQRPSQAPKLTRPERNELSALRGFKSTVRKTASNHMVLDSSLAQIILDEVDKTEKELDNVRNA
jgi:hypothetical protein